MCKRTPLVMIRYRLLLCGRHSRWLRISCNAKRLGLYYRFYTLVRVSWRARIVFSDFCSRKTRIGFKLKNFAVSNLCSEERHACERCACIIARFSDFWPPISLVFALLHFPTVNQFFFFLYPVSMMVSTRYAIAVASIVAISRRAITMLKSLIHKIPITCANHLITWQWRQTVFLISRMIYNMSLRVFSFCRSKIAETGRSDVRLSQVDPKIYLRTSYCNTVGQQRIRYVYILHYIKFLLY